MRKKIKQVIQFLSFFLFITAFSVVCTVTFPLHLLYWSITTITKLKYINFYEAIIDWYVVKQKYISEIPSINHQGVNAFIPERFTNSEEIIRIRKKVGNFKYTQEYIRENADKLDWEEASMVVDINSFPIKFIEDFKDDWNWEIILLYNNVSNEFVLNFKNEFKLNEEVSSIIGLKLKKLIKNNRSFHFEASNEKVIQKIKNLFLLYMKDRVKEIKIEELNKDFINPKGVSKTRKEINYTFKFKNEYDIWKNFNIISSSHND